MNLFLAVTDNDWFRFLRSRSPLEEVNFWRPGGAAGFRALHPGEPLLFKLHAPENFVVGGGFFAHFSRQVPVSLAWEAFGEANGAPSFAEMRRRIEKYRRIQPAPHEDYRIGCILLSQPFFFDESEWGTGRSSGCQTTPGYGRCGSFWSGMGIWCFGGDGNRSKLNRSTLAGDFVPASATPTEARPTRRALRPRAVALATASRLDPVG